MVISNAPRLRSIILGTWRPLAILFIWDVAVTAFYFLAPFRAPALPLTLFGTVLALFLGFRSNSAYARWWEARILWGAMINASRNIARAATNFLPDHAVDLKRTIVLRHIAYVNALRCQLRQQPRDEEVLMRLSPEEAEPVLARTNTASALMDGTGARIDEARRKGWIDTMQQHSMERVLIDILNAQGGMERIKKTPLPNQYRFFPNFFSKLLCILLPIGLVETLGIATPVGSTVAGLMILAVLQIGSDLTDPFADTIHDVPLTAMCRTIEIDLLELIGDEAPPPTEPHEGVLW